MLTFFIRYQHRQCFESFGESSTVINTIYTTRSLANVNHPSCFFDSHSIVMLSYVTFWESSLEENISGLLRTTTYFVNKSTFLGIINIYTFFTWGDVHHVVAPKQFNGGHVGVPKTKFCGSWNLFLCKTFLFSNKFA